MEALYYIYLVLNPTGAQLLTITTIIYYFYYCPNIKQNNVIEPVSLQNPTNNPVTNIIKLFTPKKEIHIGDQYVTPDCFAIKEENPKLYDICDATCGIVTLSSAATNNIKSPALKENICNVLSYPRDTSWGNYLKKEWYPLKKLMHRPHIYWKTSQLINEILKQGWHQN